MTHPPPNPNPAGTSSPPVASNPAPAGMSKPPPGMSRPAPGMSGSAPGTSRPPQGMSGSAPGTSRPPQGMSKPPPSGNSAETSNPETKSNRWVKFNLLEKSKPSAKPNLPRQPKPPLGKSRLGPQPSEQTANSKPEEKSEKAKAEKNEKAKAEKSEQAKADKSEKAKADKSEKAKKEKSDAPILLVYPPAGLVESLKDHQQEDVLRFWEELSAQNRQDLVKDLQSINLPRTDRIIRWSLEFQGLPRVDAIEPVTDACVSTVAVRTLDDRVRWWQMGLKAIAEGKLALVLLSGGQGTRLGSLEPKGCFQIGLHSQKSLFQLQAERIFTVQKLASRSVKAAGIVKIHWYIMTSPFNDEKIKEFFKSHKYFGLQADQITFFQQGILPCFSKDGKFIMETRYNVAKAPDGNGAVYSALKSSKLLNDMTARRVQYVDCYGVDNALVRVADPSFLGYFIDKGVAAAAKVVRKAYPQEEVGVFVQSGSKGILSVVDYTELDPSLASELNQENGQLLFCWSNVCMHMFTRDFLIQVANRIEKENIYHLVERNIPSVNGNTDGYKPEKFVFDVFPLALSSTALFEALRDEEYAPVKNKNGSNYDTPESAKRRLISLHARWVVSAGGSLSISEPSIYNRAVEVSPLCSYAGENLESVCRGNAYYGPCEIVRLPNIVRPPI